MASIVKRKSSFAVVYVCYDDAGKKKQKWETYSTLKQAEIRKAEVELEAKKAPNGFVVKREAKTVSELLDEYVISYGQKKWSLSTYDAQTALIRNYIKPLIGDTLLSQVTPRYTDYFVQQLATTKLVTDKYHKGSSDTISPRTIEKIVRLLHSAFNRAVRWELIEKNPFDGIEVEKAEYKKRDIWNKELIKKALDGCENNRLYLAINLAFACSMRAGEILGLTWDDVHIEDKDIANDDAHIFICKELQRVSLNAINTLDKKHVYKVFPSVTGTAASRLVLKRPKTRSSIRKVWLPETLAYILRQWRDEQDGYKMFLKSEYEDNNLVLCQPNGRPCEVRFIETSFAELKERLGLPNVVFHSLRHSSTTYKLKLSGGDLKATQGDTGHADISMITDIYAHIMDEDRKENAKKFENAFYQEKDLRLVAGEKAAEKKRAAEVQAEPEKASSGVDADTEALINKIRSSPELARLLSQMLNVN